MKDKQEKSEPSKRLERSEGRFDGCSPEVPKRPLRRSFTAEYKARIVEEADACTEYGEIGALLRREGLYASYLDKWRTVYRDGARRTLRERTRGPSRKPAAELTRDNSELRRKVRRLERQLDRAERLLDIQKKVSEIMGVPLDDSEEDS